MKVEHRGGVGPDQVITPAPSEDLLTMGGHEGQSTWTPQERLTAVNHRSERSHRAIEELNVGCWYATDHTPF
jgi:hypothetical protein